MRYKVTDYYEERIFGDTVFVSDSLEECKEFCKEYKEETDGECVLTIYDDRLCEERYACE